MEPISANNIIEHFNLLDDAKSSVTEAQLLDLIVWLEIFGENGCVFKQYPGFWLSTVKKIFNARPEIAEGNLIDWNSRSGINWAKERIKCLHKKYEEEFLACVKSEDFFDELFSSKLSQDPPEGENNSSYIYEDIFNHVLKKLNTIQYHSSLQNDYIVAETARVIFEQLKDKQLHYKGSFLSSLEKTLAAANEFIQMSKNCKESMDKIKETLQLQRENTLFDSNGEEKHETTIKNSDGDNENKNKIESTLDYATSDIQKSYNSDAIYSAQTLHRFIFEPMMETISSKLFTIEWEDSSTQNRSILCIVEKIQHVWDKLTEKLDENLLHYALEAIVTATVSFYIRSLLTTAKSHKSNVKSYWENKTKVLDQMGIDIDILIELFQQKFAVFEQNSESSFSAEKIEKEFEILRIIRELLGVAFDTAKTKTKAFTSIPKRSSQQKQSSLKQSTHLIHILHEKIGNKTLTSKVVGDIWHLAAASKEHKIWNHMNSSIDWRVLSSNQVFSDDESSPNEGAGTLLKIESMLTELYKDETNRREVFEMKKNPVDKMKRALSSKVMKSSKAQ